MEQKRSKFGDWLRNSITARMLVVGFLLLVLLIPLQFVKMLISERSIRQAEVVREINEKWGNEVLLSGPILKIPFKTYKEERVFDQTSKTYQTITETIIKEAFLFPDALNIKANVLSKAEPLKRSIYESVVYTADIDVDGNFPAIDLSNRDIKPEDILWEKITVIIQTSNLKGIRNSMEVTLGEETLGMTPKYGQGYLNVIQTEAISLGTETLQASIPFRLNMKTCSDINWKPYTRQRSGRKRQPDQPGCTLCSP